MELRQESLFADETKGGIEVIYSKFIDQRRMDYKALFGGFDHLRVITFSYGLGFVETVADMFEDVEIIIGSMNTVRPDIVDVAMHQKLEMKRLSKRKQLVERVKDGSVRIYFNMRKMSHEKLYILSADDGRCRIITGSANLSKRAFTGGQYEEITCFDGDVVMFDNRLARFESLKGMSSTTPLEPAAMVDFASVAGDSEGELEVVPVMRAKGVVYLCDMPEDDDEVETFYTFNPKDMTEEEREQYAAMREHKVDYKPVTGGRVIIPDEVRRVIRAAREAKAEREVRAVAYPKFHYDTESGAATLNGEAYEVQPEGAWVDDAHRISDIMRGYDSFIGDVEVTKQQFFKVLAFMFTAPFTTRSRRAASSGSMPRRRGRAASSTGSASRWRTRPRMALISSSSRTAASPRTGMTWAVPSSRPAPPSSGRVRSLCSWRTGTRQRRRTRASGATRSMARRCTSKMVASSSTRWQEGHPRGCPFPHGRVEGHICYIKPSPSMLW